MDSMSTRKYFVPPGDYSPPTEIQKRNTGLSQTGRFVVIGNPFSYVVEPGRYYPFVTLRGHNDPYTKAIEEALLTGDAQYSDFDPNPASPPRFAEGHERTLGHSLAPLADATVLQRGAAFAEPHGQAPTGIDWHTGIPHATGLVNV